MKKQSQLKRALQGAILGWSVFALVPSATAQNTAAGTPITGQATITYQVSGTTQDPVNSNSYNFVVDRKINLTVATTDGAAVTVTPGTATSVLTFTVENTGNDTQDFSLSAVARVGGTAAFGGTDNVNADGVSVFVEDGTTAGYQSGEDTDTYADEIAAGGTATVYILGDFTTGTFSNGQIASYHLLAEVREGGTADTLGGALSETTGAETFDAIDVVFADAQGTETSGDAARDAKYSEDSDFEIAAANITVTKSSAVISDPTNLTTNPKAIPGAIVEYTITISNAAGASTATSISFSDSLNAEITAGTIAFVPDGYDTGKGIEVTAPNLYAGAVTDLTNAGSDDEGDWNVTGTNTVTVSGITLAASESATIKFRVEVQ